MSREELKEDLQKQEQEAKEQERSAYAELYAKTPSPAPEAPEISDDAKDFYVDLETLRYREAHPTASPLLISSHITATKTIIEENPELARDIQTKMDKIEDFTDELTDEQEAAINYIASQRMADYREAHPDALPEELVAVSNQAKMEICAAPDASERIAQAESEYDNFVATCQRQGLVDEDGDLTETVENVAGNLYDTIVDKAEENLPLQKEVEQKVETEHSEVESLYPPYQHQEQFRVNEDVSIEIHYPTTYYGSAELKTVTNADGTSVECAMLDGQKHGAEIERDAKGNITGIKLYDHGQELDMNQYAERLNVVDEIKDGIKRTAVMVDGKPFGAEIMTDTNTGKTKAAFYDNFGQLIEGSAGAEISQTKETHTETHRQYYDVSKSYTRVHRDEFEGMCTIEAIRTKSKELEQQNSAQQIKNPQDIAMQNISLDR